MTRSTGLASHIIARPPRNQPARDPPVLSGWRDIERLKLLNIHYDVTPAKCISVLICEYGLVKSTCAAGVLRFAQDKCNA